jgi:hypothetical protein
MGVDELSAWYMRNFMSQKSVMKSFFRKQSINLHNKLCKEGAGWLIVTSEGTSVPALLQAGRKMERLWLLARERNVGIHPLSQVLEQEKWRCRFDSLHPADMNPQLILRVGYVKEYPTRVSLRRPVSSFVKP